MKDEKTLKENLALGKRDAFQALFNQYHNQLCAYAMSIIADTDEAKEIAQQCFIYLWEHRTDALKIDSLKQYLFKSAYNICMNRFKHEKVKDRYANDEAYFLKSCSLENFENTFSEDLGQEIRNAVKTLPDKNREVFELRFFRGFDTIEVSEQLHISPRTVETHVSNAYKLLREKLIHLLTIFIIFFS